MPNKIPENEETLSTFLKDSQNDFDRYKSDRDTFGFDEKMKVADGMWRCFRNRTLADSEQDSSTGDGEDEIDFRANIGSGRFFRMVNQKASLGYAVGSSVDVPFKYETVGNADIWGSREEAQSQASIHNALARYAWKNGNCDQKMYQFWFQEHKYCNIPVQVVWNEERKRIAVKDPKTDKVSWKDKIVRSYPTFKTLHWSMLYADMYCPTIQDQNCVVVLSVVPWTDIQRRVKLGQYDKEKVMELRENKEKAKWDGTEGSEARSEQVENAGDSGYSPGESELFLVWDVYRWAPIKNGEYDEEADYELYWCTAIGNTLGAATVVRFEKDFDPDGEVPITIVKAIPDDSDLLYSMSWSDAVRAPYSIECTLWEASIDNIIGRNNPMFLYDSSLFKTLPSDFQYKAGAKYDVDDVTAAMQEFAPIDNTAQTAQLISLIQNEEGVSASINANMMGEAYGGRTPASESLAINRFSEQPNLGETSYILHQLIGFVARKYKSYFQAFGDPTMIKQIADESLDAPAYEDVPGYKIYGDFDVEVNVVDEFMEDYVQANQELQLLQTVAAAPQLMQSRSHSVDVGEWMKGILRRLKVQNVDRIVKPASGTDAHLRQRDEIRYMIKTGEYIAPQETEDHDAHIAELQGEILRWEPLTKAKLSEEASPDMLAQQQQAGDILTMLLLPHKQAHEQMKLNAAGNQNMTAPSGETTPGQAAGNVPAAILGGAAGGIGGQ